MTRENAVDERASMRLLSKCVWRRDSKIVGRRKVSQSVQRIIRGCTGAYLYDEERIALSSGCYPVMGTTTAKPYTKFFLFAKQKNYFLRQSFPDPDSDPRPGNASLAIVQHERGP